MGIKEKLPLLNSESKGKRIAGYVLYAWIFLMIIGAILPSPDTGGETTTTSATTTPVEAETAAATVEDDNLTEKAVEKMIGKQQSISVNPVSGYVVIRRPDQDFWSLVLQEDDATKMFEKLFKDPRVKLVRITTYLEGVDAYGQKVTNVGTRFIMSRETADKINWDNFLYSRLPDVADEAYINPVLLD